MKCYICDKEIKDNQSRVTLWIDHDRNPVKTVHRKCRDEKYSARILPYGYGHHEGMKKFI